MLKVIPTYGPSIYDDSILSKVMEVADVIRINLSHQGPQEGIDSFNRLNAFGKPIMLDTSGPEVRLRSDNQIDIKKGEKFEIGNDSSFKFYFDHDMSKVLVPGDLVYFDDGLSSTKLIEIKGKNMIFEALDNITLKNKKRVNLKGKSFDCYILKENDIVILESTTPEYVALSYTRNAQDVLDAKKHTKAKIIAKIENYDGIKNFNEIIKVADGVMVARGDLGVEIPHEEVPIVQKMLIRVANEYGKPSIVATQVLTSMVENNSPTRAEVNDIANAALDGADAIMLSNETAVGKFPIEAMMEVKKVSKNIAPYVESTIKLKSNSLEFDVTSDILSKTVYLISKNKHVDKIVVLSRTGYSVRLISRFKHSKEIIAITTDPVVAKEVNLLYGVKSVVWEHPKNKLIESAANICLEKNLISEEDTVVFVAGLKTVKPHLTNLIEIHEIKDMLQYRKEQNAFVEKE
jgi:pyruvate kinase